MTEPESLFSRVGGAIQLRRVHKIFYDKVYAHPWLGQFFEGIDQQHLEGQQTDFMTKTLGGPAVYCGGPPVPAHRHLHITDELLAGHSRVLAESPPEAGAPGPLAQEWLERDRTSRKRLVKASVADCQRRFANDEILDFPRPQGRATG